jgi:hypothetical protein
VIIITGDIFMKKLNHYVWQHYLKPWTDGNGKIICKRNGKIFAPGTNTIAAENFFYKLNPLTVDEFKFIRKVFFSDINKIVLEIDEQWLYIFSLINNLISLKDKIKDDELQKSLDILAKEFNENVHTFIENIGGKYLKFLYNENISFYYDEKGNIEFNIFLCEQYFRTRQMKETIMKRQIPIRNVNYENCWNIVSHVLSINLAATLSAQKGHFKCCLLKNNTDISLYTSDQPVINIGADNKNPKKLTAFEFEFYYPITPKLAFLICVKDNFLGAKETLELTENNVKNYNAKMISQCGDIVFSNNRNGLI